MEKSQGKDSSVFNAQLSFKELSNRVNSKGYLKMDKREME